MFQKWDHLNSCKQTKANPTRQLDCQTIPQESVPHGLDNI